MADLTRKAVIDSMRLGEREVERLHRAFYATKAATYRSTLLGLLERYGESRKQIRLSPAIREALDREAERDANSVIDTLNVFVRDEARRRSELTPELLARHLAGYLRTRGHNRAALIARAEAAPARLDAQIAFFRENGVEPQFDLVGPVAKCPICKALKGGGPWEIGTVVTLGQIHIGCTHSWKARLYSADKLRVGGLRPGQISAGRGEIAGIVNGPISGGYPTAEAAAAAIESGRLGA